MDPALLFFVFASFCMVLLLFQKKSPQIALNKLAENKGFWTTSGLFASLYLLSLSFMVISGAFNGASEAYDADPRIFEKKYSVNEKGWFGSKSWYLGYVDYPDDKRDRYLGVNSFLSFTKDFSHASEAAMFIFSFLGAFLFGLNFKAGSFKWYEQLIRIGLFLICYSVTSFLIYQFLRYV